MNNKARQKLRYILTRYGLAGFNDPRRCEALLRDLCPECKREINLLISALKENVALDLMAPTDSAMKKMAFERLAERMYENLGIVKKFAIWAVESWAWALTAIPDEQPLILPGKTPAPQCKRPECHPILRSHSMTVSDNDAKELFYLDGNWQPKQYIFNDYYDNGDSTIADRSTGLMWQQGGSGFKSYEKVWIFVKELNDRKFAGYADWRVPTVEELLSLLEPEKQFGDLYIDPSFDSRQIWCWSSDKRDTGGAWSVHFGEGKVICNFLTCNIRAVRS